MEGKKMRDKWKIRSATSQGDCATEEGEGGAGVAQRSATGCSDASLLPACEERFSLLCCDVIAMRCVRCVRWRC